MPEAFFRILKAANPVVRFLLALAALAVGGSAIALAVAGHVVMAAAFAAAIAINSVLLVVLG